VLDHLNEQLGRFELAAQRRGYRPDDRFEHLGQPPVRGLLLVVVDAFRDDRDRLDGRRAEPFQLPAASTTAAPAAPGRTGPK